MVTALTHTT